MKRLRPIVASLLAGILAFQLVLAGRGALCITWERGAMPMGQHVMAGETTGPAVAVSVARGGSGSGDATPMPGAPCDRSDVPAQCLAMAACAGAFVASPVAGGHAPLPRPSRVIAALVTAAPAPAFPPEPPPPRA